MSTKAIFTNEPSERRRKLGWDRRRQVPRSSLGIWEPPADRPDPIDVMRVDAARVASRYVRSLPQDRRASTWPEPPADPHHALASPRWREHHVVAHGVAVRNRTLIIY